MTVRPGRSPATWIPIWQSLACQDTRFSLHLRFSYCGTSCMCKSWCPVVSSPANAQECFASRDCRAGTALVVSPFSPEACCLGDGFSYSDTTGGTCNPCIGNVCMCVCGTCVCVCVCVCMCACVHGHVCVYGLCALCVISLSFLNYVMMEFLYSIGTVV